MPAFDTEPTDAELAVILDPEGRSQSVRVEDTPERLVAQPRGIPLWFMALSLALPIAGYAGVLVIEALQQQIRAPHFLGLALGCAATVFFIWLFRRMNREQVSKGDFFILDKERKVLMLPRRGLQIRDTQVRAFVEVHAWHTEWSEDRRESSSDWLGELSVLASTDHGEMVRYPVITCMRIGRVTRLATKLADFFGVERRILSQTPFSGN